LLALAVVAARPALADDQQPTVYFALIATPGPHWDPARKFQEQRGIAEHIAYLKRLRDEGTLVMAGPFLDGSGELTIISVPGIEDAKLVAIDDPAAGSGLLTVTVKPWLIGISKD
jgi:uncharacterized protein YciI